MNRSLASILVLVAALALPVGLVLPLIELDRLYFFTETPSLLQVITGLWSDGSPVLACVLAVASVLLPVAKIASLQLFLAGTGAGYVRHLHALGRWSLMDVLIVALVIFGAKTSGVASAASQPGLWFYALSALSAAGAALAVERGSDQLG